MKLSEFQNMQINSVDSDAVRARLESWTDSDWEGAYENWMEYKAAFGPDATKGYAEFAYGIAAQNVLFSLLKDAQ